MPTKGEIFKIRSKNKIYWKTKYGVEEPEIIIEAEDTTIWPNGGWGMQQGNPACLCYAMRGAVGDIPDTGKVYYGHIVGSGLGELVHESELIPPEPA